MEEARGRTHRWQGWSPVQAVQEDQLSFGAPFVKKGKGGRVAFRHRSSNATWGRSDDVKLDGFDKTTAFLAADDPYHVVNWRAFRLFVNVAYSLLNGAGSEIRTFAGAAQGTDH